MARSPILVVLLLAFSSATATVIHVPADQPTVQAGIDAATSGDTVMVATGVYYETIVLKDGVRLLGAGAETTTINGGDAGTVVQADAVGSGAMIDGFTIRDGWVTSYDWGFGGGLSIRDGSTLTVSHNIIISNRARRGGGMTIDGSSPIIRDNVIELNLGDLGGGGLYISGESSLELVRNVVRYNEGSLKGGGIYMQYTAPGVMRLDSNVIVGNAASRPESEGGGMYNVSSWFTAANNTIAQNRSIYGCGAFFYQVVQPQTVHFTNSIFYNQYNNIMWNEGVGPQTDCCLIGRDPLFCDRNGDDYLVASNSPCAPWNNSYLVHVGATEIGCGPRGPITVQSRSPEANDHNAPRDSRVSATFGLYEDGIDESTLNAETFVVTSPYRGRVTGAIVYDDPSRTVSLIPEAPFRCGEQVSVVVTDEVESGGGYSLEKPHGWSFTACVSSNNCEFQPGARYPSGNNPNSVIAVDLDVDGDLDLVSGSEGVYGDADSTLTVLVNDGSGAFTPGPSYTLPGRPQGLCSGDFDEDGVPDLAVTLGTLDAVLILLNAGDGSFPDQSTRSMGDYPLGVIAADLDRDGHMDLAGTNASDNTISILYGRGDGTFESQTVYGVGHWPCAIVALDINDDGDFDLAVANHNLGTITLYRNTGWSQFSYDTCYEVHQPANLCAGDFDGDGDVDLAAADWVNDSLHVLFNEGNGDFAAAVSFPTASGPESMVAFDIDGDFDLDLLTANSGGISGGVDSTVSVLRNDGGGQFVLSDDIVTGPRPMALATADVNGDGFPDLVTANGNSDDCAVILNSGAADCCQGRVGDANGQGGDEPTIGDIALIIDAKFITMSCDPLLFCLTEADVNQSGGDAPTCDDIGLSDIALVIDYLFITGSSLGLPDCL